MYKACVRSGFCCKRGPCPYGESVSADNPACKFLVGDKPGEYSCGKYDEIIKDPSSAFSPAFGAGCSSTLFNPERDQVLIQLGNRKGAKITVDDPD